MKPSASGVLLITVALTSLLQPGLCAAATFEPNQVIVKFVSGAMQLPQSQPSAARSDVIASEDLSGVLASTGVTTLARVVPTFNPSDTLQTSFTGTSVVISDLSNVYLLTLADGTDVLSTVASYSGRSDVIYAQPNYIYQLLLTPSDPLYPSQWPLQQSSLHNIGMPSAWGITVGDPSVRLSIIDSGIDYSHPEFAGHFGTGWKVVSGWDYFGSASDPKDTNFHGTAVAGVAAALTNNVDTAGQAVGISGIAGGWGYDARTNTGNSGVQIDARIVSDGYGQNITSDKVAGAVTNCHSQVINLSIGAQGAEDYFEAEAIYNAASVGAVVVVASGNDDLASLDAPASYDPAWLLSVGATKQDGGRATWYTGVGSNYGDFLAVVAPGDEIWTTMPTYVTNAMASEHRNPNYADIRGTSIAAPFVSGVAALLMSRDHTLRGDDVRGLIKATADDLGQPGYDIETGYGQVNAGRALSANESPRRRYDYTAIGGTDVGQTGQFQMPFYRYGGSLASSRYLVRRHEVQKTIAFPDWMVGPKYAWGRSLNSATVGWSPNVINFETPYCDVLWRDANSTTFTVRTYIYEVWDVGGGFLGWYPCTPQNCHFAYTILGEPVTPTVAVSGPDNLSVSASGTWSASPSGGDGTYAYEWRTRSSHSQAWSDVAGSASSFQTTMGQTDLEVQVTLHSGGKTVTGAECCYNTASPVTPSASVQGPFEVARQTNGAWSIGATGGRTCGYYTYDWRSRPLGTFTWSNRLSATSQYARVMDQGPLEFKATVGPWAGGASSDSPVAPDGIDNLPSSTEIDWTVIVPPAAISDLGPDDLSSTIAYVSWSAPADGGAGLAEYDLRYSSSQINDQNFSSATRVTLGTPTPGGFESGEITNLHASTHYYVAIKTKDNAGWWSTISNVGSFTTLSGGGGGASAQQTYGESGTATTSRGYQTAAATLEGGGVTAGERQLRRSSVSITAGDEIVETSRLSDGMWQVVIHVDSSAAGIAATDTSGIAFQVRDSAGTWVTRFVAPGSHVGLCGLRDGCRYVLLGNGRVEQISSTLQTRTGALAMRDGNQSGAPLSEDFVRDGGTVSVALGDTLRVTYAPADTSVSGSWYAVTAGAALSGFASHRYERGSEMQPPTSFALLQNRPNPFGQSTALRFDLPAPSHVRLEVFDMQGRRVRRLADGPYEAGRWSVDWDGTGEAGQVIRSGVYLYRIEAGRFRSQRKMVLLP
jgi:thermitase